MHIVGEGPGETPSALRGLSYLISSFLKDIKHLPKTSKGAFFLSPSDVYVRSFPYIYYILIKDCYTKSSKQSSLISNPGSKSSPLEVINPSKTHSSQQKPSSVQSIWFLCGVPFLRGVTRNQSLFLLYIQVYSVRKVEAESGQSKPEFQEVRASGNFPLQRKTAFFLPQARPSRGSWFFPMAFIAGIKNHQFPIWYFQGKPKSCGQSCGLGTSQPEFQSQLSHSSAIQVASTLISRTEIISPLCFSYKVHVRLEWTSENQGLSALERVHLVQFLSKCGNSVQSFSDRCTFFFYTKTETPDSSEQLLLWLDTSVS